jgi:class 3 adenylate cyclase
MAEALTQAHEAQNESGPLDGLVEFLRAHPYKLDHSVPELAKRFALDEEFVADVLDTLRGSPNKLPTKESVFKALRVTAQMIGSYLSNLYDEFTERPLVAIPITIILTIAVMLLLRSLSQVGLLPVPADEVRPTLENSAALLGVALLLLHTFIYFRHGMLRYALYGTGVTLVLSTVTLLYLGSNISKEVLESVAPGQSHVALLLGVGFVITVFYFAFSVIVCLGGGYWHTSQADRKQRNLSRQELIDRLFYLQAWIRAQSQVSKIRRPQSLAAHLRTTPWLPIYAIAVGLAVGAATVLVRGMQAGPAMEPEVADAQMPGLVRIVYQTLTAVAFVSLGYFAGGLRRAFVAMVLVYAGTLVAELIPLSYFGPAYFDYLRDSGKLLTGLVNTLTVALIVGVGAHIDRRARVRQKLQEHDPAYVLAEIVEIQWRLNPRAASSCVVFVDVAGSTRMKADADPLAVEYSFRAFHGFVAGITSKRGGSVLSTAGDGAVLTFASCAEALYAAKEIQTRMDEFNTITNRLPSSFRVRVGIHTGQVSAQLAEVPFNELIDIAAHVEKEAPVGGIAVTQSVAESLGDERVAALKEPVDGLNVYLVLNPTLAT